MKLGEIYRVFASSVAVMLIAVATCMAATSVSLNQNGSTSQTTAVTSVEETAQDNSKAKAAAKKPNQKSVLDADVLESPISFLKSAFADEESSEASGHASTLMVAVKALFATLLSTII